VGPTQFVTQCVTVREGAIEEPHVPQIRRVEASPKFGSQPLRQPGREGYAVTSRSAPACSELDDATMCLPTSQQVPTCTTLQLEGRAAWIPESVRANRPNNPSKATGGP
jgi:hypothetical protein